ncbi:hypothetical protein [Roseateles oligotrophus]|nr:hypothetical protein [Roseateles oligotrophus]
MSQDQSRLARPAALEFGAARAEFDGGKTRRNGGSACPNGKLYG